MSNSTSVQHMLEQATYFVGNSLSENTRIAYEIGWKIFTQWTEQNNSDPWKEKNVEALVAFFLSDLAMKGGHKISSLIVFLSGIRWVYASNGIYVDTKSEVLSRVLRGIKRHLGCRPFRKEPIVTDRLKSMTSALDTSRPIGIRDRALLVLGFAGAFRRSELVSLNIEDLSESDQGFLVLLRKSKTDQNQEGFIKAIPYGSTLETCPVRSIKALLNVLDRTSGPLFTQIKKGDKITEDRLSSHAVGEIIKRNPNILEERMFAGHSLRSGFVTSAARNNVPVHLIMQQTGHKSVENLMVYIRDAQKLSNCAASMVGL